MSGLWKYGAVFLLFLCTALFAAEGFLEKLPEDMQMQAEVVHKLKYPWAKSNDISLSYTNLYGDKFLTSYGVTLNDTFYLTESLGARLGVSYFTHSISDEVIYLKKHGLEPQMADPEWMASLLAVYQPLYGKLMLGSYLQRLKWGVHAGVHAVKEKIEGGNYYLTYDNFIFGPTLGTELVLPISEHFSIQTNVQFMLHSSVASSDLKHLWAFSLGAGWRL